MKSCEVRAQAKLILVLASRTLYRLLVNSFVTVDNNMLIITPAGHLVACDSFFVAHRHHFEVTKDGCIII